MPVGCRTYLGPSSAAVVVGTVAVTQSHPMLSGRAARSGRLGGMTEIYENVPEETEQLDQDQLQSDTNLENRGVEDALDEGYSPPESYSTLIRHGDHETLDERLAEEEPD